MRPLPRSPDLGRLIARIVDSVRRGSRALAASRWSRSLRLILLFAVIAVLGERIHAIGLETIWQALPAAPVFYLLFVLLYASLPISEAVIYARLWRRPMWRHLGSLFLKQAYNFGILAYAGESWLALWARRHLGLEVGTVLRAIKDNNIVSAFASNAMTLALLLLILLFPGGLAALGTAIAPLALLGAAAVLAGIMVAVLLFRRRIFSLPRPALLRLFAIHLARLAIVVVLQALQWAVALPDVPLSLWIALIGLQFVITRLPLVPNKDLVFLAVALGLLAGTGVDEGRLAAVLLASLGLAQLAHLAVFVLSGARIAGRGAAEPIAIADGQ
ncbi:MAG: hypothetical protein D6807_02835 [Alphaproteobacteria bacterium]|nr:MAG: hypothetical protein D6807_02835 [Alphaproteobacteria bacterium]